MNQTKNIAKKFAWMLTGALLLSNIALLQASQPKSYKDSLQVTGLLPDVQRIVASYVGDWALASSNTLKEPVFSSATDYYLNRVVPKIASQDVVEKIKKLKKIKPHIEYSPQGTYAVVSEQNGTVRIFETKYNTEIQKIQSGWTWSAALAFVSDNQLLIAMKHNLLLFDVTSGSYLTINSYTHHNPRIKKLACSPNGKYIAVGLHDGSIDILENSNRRRFEIIFQHQGAGQVMSEISGLSFTCDSRKLVATHVGVDLIVFAERDAKLIQHDEEIQAPRRVFEQQGNYVDLGSVVFDLQCSPININQIVIVHAKEVIVYNTVTREKIKQMRKEESSFVAARFSHNGTFLFLALSNGTIEVYDINQLFLASFMGKGRGLKKKMQKPIAIIQAHAESIGCIACSPRGYEFKSMGITDNIVKNWKTVGDLIFDKTEIHNQSKVKTISLTPSLPYKQQLTTSAWYVTRASRTLAAHAVAQNWAFYALGKDKTLNSGNLRDYALFNLMYIPTVLSLLPRFTQVETSPEDTRTITRSLLIDAAACLGLGVLQSSLQYWLSKK